MASWYDAKLLFCLLFVFCCYTVIEGEIARDCCLTVRDTKIPKHRVKDYQHQTAGQGCSINAMVFTTRRGINLCAPDNKQWVKDLMTHVDKLKIACREAKYKGSRCVGLKPQ
ncbi:monocyte chemotactic protein 1B-like [Polymixia lowei]